MTSVLCIAVYVIVVFVLILALCRAAGKDER